MQKHTSQINTTKKVSDQFAQNFDMRGIGPKSFPFILKFFENMSFEDMRIVLQYSSFLYYSFSSRDRFTS